jgi:hypothetical protein
MTAAHIIIMPSFTTLYSNEQLQHNDRAFLLFLFVSLFLLARVGFGFWW